MKTIVTSRLELIPYRQELIEATLLGDEKLTQVSGFQVAKGWPGVEFFFYLPFVLEEVRRDASLEHWTYLVVVKEKQMIIGEVSAQGNPLVSGIAEIGYGIVDEFKGNGYATEATIAFIDFLEASYSFQLVAKAYQHHQVSHHILQKLGFHKTGEELLGGDELIFQFEKPHL